MTDHIHKAVVCKKGHIATYTLNLYEEYDTTKNCNICKSELFSHCSSCSEYIKGETYYTIPNVIGWISYLPFELATVCKCGESYPWNTWRYRFKQKIIRIKDLIILLGKLLGKFLIKEWNNIKKISILITMGASIIFILQYLDL